MFHEKHSGNTPKRKKEPKKECSTSVQNHTARSLFFLLRKLHKEKQQPWNVHFVLLVAVI